MDPYIVFLDVDGTLVGSDNSIPQSAIDAVREARKNGHHVYLCTGRCMAEIFPDILEIGFDGMIGSSGGYILSQGKELRHLTFSKDELKEIRKYFQEHGIGGYYECNHGLHVDPIYMQWIKETLQGMDGIETYMNVLIPVQENQEVTDVNKISFVSEHYPIAEIEQDFQDRFQVIHNTVPMFGGDICGEIALANIHKADAIDVVLKQYEKPYTTLAVGDSDNDTEMLQYVDIGVAVKSATETLLKAADEVTDAPEDNGIYHCFVKHGLIERKEEYE